MDSTVTVSKSIEFDAGHRVARHGSKCRNPHGHRWKVTLTVAGMVKTDGGVEHGMVIDFGRIKEFLTEHVHDRYDHGFIVEASDAPMLAALAAGEDDWKVEVVDFTPTSENLAESIGYSATAFFFDEPLQVVKVEVYETPTSVATCWMPA